MIDTFEYGIISLIQSFSNSFLDLVMAGISFFGNPIFWFGIAVLLYWQGKVKDSFFIANLILCAAVVVNTLKPIIGRIRPNTEIVKVLAEELTSKYSTYSMPSGHATMIASAYAYFSKIISRELKVIFLILVFLVALSRIYLGVHFPTDTIVGLGLGFIIGLAIFKMQKQIEVKQFKLGINFEFGIICIILALLLIFILTQPKELGALFLSFYGGFFIVRETGFQQRAVKGYPLMFKLLFGFGVAIIALIAMMYFLHTLTEKIAIAIFSGLWITILWPFIFDKIFLE